MENYSQIYIAACMCTEVLTVLVSIMVLALLTPDMGPERELQLVRRFIFFFLCFAGTNTVCLFANYYHAPRIGYPFSALNQVFICLCAFFWLLYIEYKIDSRRVERRGFIAVLSIPLIFVSALIISTIATHLVFYYDAEGNYQRGPLYLSMIIFGLVYMSVASIHLGLKMRRIRTRTERSYYMLLVLFLFFPVTAGLIDFFVPRIPTMEAGLLLGIIMLFTSMQRGKINQDSLTGLNNRRRTDTYLLDTIENCSLEKPFYYFMGDVDLFKNINDTYGHSTGDEALRIIGCSLAEVAASTDGFAARWGGDEYVMIVEKNRVKSPEAFLSEIHDAIRRECKKRGTPFDIRMSFGYAELTSSQMDPESVLKQADAMLYKEKQNRRKKP